MIWHVSDTWVVVTGALAAGACALVGSWLVLRRLSMMGDAISHAVLPGLAIGFLVTGARDSLPMFVGAAVVGVLTAVFTRWIHRLGRVDQNASMGVVFTSLFAIGLLLIGTAASHVDLDPGCVLYGAIELVPLDVVELGPWLVPRAVVVLGVVYLIDLLVILALYKELTLSAFDGELATTLGFDADRLLYLLMALVALTTVAAFEAVGSIVVIAMLIVPAATARLLTDRLWAMLAVSQLLAAAAALAGHWSAVVVPTWFGYRSTNTAGMMAVVSGLLFVLTVCFGPGQGVLAQIVRGARLRLSILCDDVLGVLFRLEELAPDRSATGWPAAELGTFLHASPWSIGLATRRLTRDGRLRALADGFALTDDGRRAAAQLVRSHRLWEAFLAAHLGLPADHVHNAAHRLEHLRGFEPELEASVPDVAEDPHGRPIPGP